MALDRRLSVLLVLVLRGRVLRCPSSSYEIKPINAMDTQLERPMDIAARARAEPKPRFEALLHDLRGQSAVLTDPEPRPKSASLHHH